jgi:hypothetical protein
MLTFADGGRSGHGRPCTFELSGEIAALDQAGSFTHRTRTIRARGATHETAHRDVAHRIGKTKTAETANANLRRAVLVAPCRMLSMTIRTPTDAV